MSSQPSPSFTLMCFPFPLSFLLQAESPDQSPRRISATAAFLQALLESVGGHVGRRHLPAVLSNEPDVE